MNTPERAWDWLISNGYFLLKPDGWAHCVTLPHSINQRRFIRAIFLLTQASLGEGFTASYNEGTETTYFRKEP